MAVECANMNNRFRWLVAILVALLCSNAASPTNRKSPFKGRIAAYRPADRMQVVSFAQNRELLLFHVHGASEEFLKLVYVHQRFSDLKDDVLGGMQSISISARRDPSCDQTFGAFEKDAPAIPLQDGGTASTERIVFAAAMSRPAESYRMKCYILEHWTRIR